MKYTTVRSGATLLAGALILSVSGVSEAGWGNLRGGSSGGGSFGSTGASYGSSGYTANYGSSGYTASYGSSGYASSGGSGGSSGRVGLLQRLKSHVAAKRARRAAYGSSGYASGGSSGYTSYASGGSSGYSYRSAYASGGSSGSVHTSSYGSSGYTPAVSYGSSGGAVSYGSTGSSLGSVGSTYYGASNSSTAPVTSLVSNVSGDSVHLTVAVPSDAKIFVNGNPTTSVGSVRQFVSRGLKPDKSYKFVVRAEIKSASGETMVEEKELKVTAGERENLQFAFADYDAPVETALTLNVPEGAKVVLAGNPTKATGESRVYRTSNLKPGQVWDDYQVEVHLGDQVKRRSIRLIGGDRLQLTFAFDEGGSNEKLAAR